MARTDVKERRREGRTDFKEGRKDEWTGGRTRGRKEAFPWKDGRTDSKGRNEERIE